VLDNPIALKCVKYIANAANIKLEPLQGNDLGGLAGFSTIEQRDANTPVYQATALTAL